MTFDIQKVESKLEMLREAKHSLVIIQERQSWGLSLLDQKLDPISNQDFKFLGYEGLIHKKLP